MGKARYGKMRQVNAVNGSQMVVKIGMAYYRAVKGIIGIYTCIAPGSLSSSFRVCRWSCILFVT